MITRTKAITLIGLHGLKRSGKDTFAGLIHSRLPTVAISPGERLPMTWKRDSFAAPLREFCLRTFGVTEENRDQHIEAIEMTGRKFQQKFGTEIGRQIHDRFWIESVRHRNGDLRHLILTDVRFDNEAWFVRESGGIIVHIIRPNNPLVASVDTHASEEGIRTNYIDYTVMNEGTLDNLAVSADDFVNWYKARFAFERDH